MYLIPSLAISDVDDERMVTCSFVNVSCFFRIGGEKLGNTLLEELSDWIVRLFDNCGEDYLNISNEH